MRRPRHHVEPSRLNVSEGDAIASYLTPPEIVERVRALLGSIDLDPATTTGNPVRATRFYTQEDDGILQPWDAERIFVNPPFGRTIAKWMEKALRVAAAGSRIVFLAPVRADSRWWQDGARHANAVLLLRGRLKFGKGGGHDAAPFATCLFGFNVALESLADLGVVVKAQVAA
jgi:site-specific DNA-methyltransferase (adenine-specific)